MKCNICGREYTKGEPNCDCHANSFSIVGSTANSKTITTRGNANPNCNPPCWCNPQVVSFNLSLGDVIHEGIENGKEVSYTMGDILMGCHKIMKSEPPNQNAWNDIHNRIIDILVCGGLIKEEE